jgi:hypothetical protein
MVNQREQPNAPIDSNLHAGNWISPAHLPPKPFPRRLAEDSE